MSRAVMVMKERVEIMSRTKTTVARVGRRRPSRTDLLGVIAVLQNTIGSIGSATCDRNPNRQAHIDHLVAFGMSVAIEARNHDSPYAGLRSDWHIPLPDLAGVS